MANNKKVTRGMCYICGKIHENIPLDKDDKVEKVWRFKCDICSTYKIFIGDEYVNRLEHISKHITKCKICNTVLEDVGMACGMGIGYDIYKCKCGDRLLVTYY